MRVKRLIKISMIICVGICLSGCAAWFFPLRSAVDPNRYYVLRMPTKCKRCKWVFQIPDSTDNASGKAAIAMYNRKDTLFIDFVDSVYVGDMSRSLEDMWKPVAAGIGLAPNVGRFINTTTLVIC